MRLTADNHPVDVARFIQLSTEKALRRPKITAWYSCVVRYAPSGVVTVVPARNDTGHLASVQLIHRKTDSRHCYLIPLTRDLNDAEVESIVQHFANAQPDLDFEVETNETKLVAHDCGEIPLDTAKHLALCTALAKSQHEDWVRERTDAGWRYGTKSDEREKTHPLLLPWEQLPERFRRSNPRLPQKFLDLLNSHGYAVLHRDELDHLMGQLEKTA